MRFSEFLIPTLREDPAEAEVVSHRLMLRAGMIRRLAAGIYATLPLGERVIQKTSAIIREEMNAAGAIEVTLPFVQPAEIWHESGRWQVYGKELLRLKDRHSREFCLGPTHEEVVTDLVRGVVSSYRQLPLTLYQIHIKFRDEIRPRFGVMRAREFIMKDAYSFDADESGAEASYERMRAAYGRIFERLGLTFRAVEADSGPIGGNFSHEFMVLADTGEDVIVCCSACDYAANTEKAEIRPPADSALPQEDALPVETIDTPGMRTIAEVGAFLSRAPERFVKTLVLDTDSGPVVALVRGDHDINEIKLRNYLGCAELALADEAVIERVTGAPRGFAGPVGLENVRVVADYGLQGCGNMVTGANRADAHLLNVTPGRDFTITEWADIRLAADGDACPRCGRPMTTTRGIEVGHIFKLGTKYSTAMQATYLDAGGTAHPMVMGCYGIGVGRTVAAAIEQSHDENGIIFPMPIAPFAVLVVLVNPTDTAQRDIAESVYRGLVDAGVDVLLDDRDERPGSKFKDADLIGIPLRVTVGRSAVGEGIVDVKDRKSAEVVKMPVAETIAHVVSWLQGRS